MTSLDWARGRQAAQQATRLVSDWALSVVGFARIEIFVDPENTASCAVAERAGFSCEGVLRSNVLLRGQRRDSVGYALLR